MQNVLILSRLLMVCLKQEVRAGGWRKRRTVVMEVFNMFYFICLYLNTKYKGENFLTHPLSVLDGR